MISHCMSPAMCFSPLTLYVWALPMSCMRLSMLFFFFLTVWYPVAWLHHDSVSFPPVDGRWDCFQGFDMTRPCWTLLRMSSAKIISLAVEWLDHRVHVSFVSRNSTRPFLVIPIDLHSHQQEMWVPIVLHYCKCLVLWDLLIHASLMMCLHVALICIPLVPGFSEMNDVLPWYQVLTPWNLWRLSAKFLQIWLS